MVTNAGFVEAENVTDAWHQWHDMMDDMRHNGFKEPSRAGNIVGEVLNAITVIKDPTNNLVKSQIRNLSTRYAIGELLWYLSGSNKVSDIDKFSKFWETISDDGETVNSAYGHRIFNKFGFNQWEHIVNLLKKDPKSRQAVIHIKDADDTPTKDVPCTLTLQYLIREGKLYATTNMRSNDLWLGFPYDIFAFTSLQMLLAMQLGVDIGEYTHIAGSLHLYERDVKKDENGQL